MHFSARLSKTNITGELGVEIIHADRLIKVADALSIGKDDIDSALDLGSGADGARTRDLRYAIPTLFQLSYSPQLVIGGEVYRGLLVISGRGRPQVNQMLAGNHVDRQQVAAVEVSAVSGQSVNLIAPVCAPKVPAPARA